jgi:transcriptional regulator with XRE-family HTH domain
VDSLISIGAQLRQSRLDAHLSLRDLAVKSGLSSSFLSLVERGECSLSLTSLFAIAEALGLEPSALLQFDPAAQSAPREFSVWRGTEGASGSMVVGEREYFPFMPGFEGRQFETLYFQIHPTKVVSPLATHEGEEVAFVTHGELSIRVRDEEITLSAGHAIHFPSTVPHTIFNKTTDVVEALWVMTRPSYGIHDPLA